MTATQTGSQQKISIALCTYNGERFLSRQLTSLQQQTVLPYELVICDDCSTDGTVAILREFAASVSFPVRITQNEHNLGFVANFDRAIRLCQGDLIALCDQDDVWYPIRLERSEQEFAAHPEAGLVFSDADVMDDHDQLTGMRLWSNFGFTGERKQRLLAGDYSVFVKNRFVTGATVMFRSRLRDHCLPIGSGWLHDEWITAIVAAVAEVRPIDIPLIRYREHSSQQVGLSRPPSFREKNARHWTEMAKQIGLLEEMCRRLSTLPLSARGEGLASRYQAHLRFARFRYGLPRARLSRLSSMLRQRASYRQLGSGVFSMASDLVLAKH